MLEIGYQPYNPNYLDKIILLQIHAYTWVLIHLFASIEARSKIGHV